MAKKRRGKIIICKCGKTSVNYGFGLCNLCYGKKYRKSHPEETKKRYEQQKKWKRLKYNTDPEYREKIREREKKWFSIPENREKALKRMREYSKKHIRRPMLSTTRIGYMCSCGTIDRARISGRVPKKPKHPSGQEYKCPNCGSYSAKRKVIYNRFTGEVEK
jgi:hypothetical protein